MKKISTYFWVLNLLILILMWGFAIVHFKDLPKTIPTHFGINGVADGFGRKQMLFFLPGIATFISILLYFVPRFPQSPLLNVSENLLKNPEALRLFVAILHFLAVVLFADLLYETTLVATEKLSELTSFSTIWIIMILVFSIGFNFLFKKIK